MRRKSHFLLLILYLLFIFSCTSYKKIPYLQTERQNSGEVVKYTSLYTENIARFQPDDILGITVNTVEEKASASDFNLPLQPAAEVDVVGEGIVTQGYGRQTYLVNKNGEIDFPVLGTIKVQGYTKDELEKYLKKSLAKILKEEPIITIRLLNFKISVLGEVGHPGQFNVTKDNINILEALTMAGDMTIYGKRDNVQVMRKKSDGEISIAYLDVSRADVISSPYFYLKQDDVVYVQPNKTKAKSSAIGSQTSILISLGSMLLTLANLIVLFVKK